MNLSVFEFEQKTVRVLGTAQEPWFVARDVADILDISKQALSVRLEKMPDEWKGIRRMLTPAGSREMLVVSEYGLYELIMRSDCFNKPEVREFQKWVYSILREIRLTGSFSLHPQESAKEQADRHYAEYIQQMKQILRISGRVEDLLSTSKALTRSPSQKTLLNLCFSDLQELKRISDRLWDDVSRDLKTQEISNPSQLSFSDWDEEN